MVSNTINISNNFRIIIKQRKRALHAKNCCKTNISSHHNNYDNDNNRKSISNRLSFGDESNSNQEENSSFCQCDDVEDEDESPIFTKAILQHYVVVWASILTSPKGLSTHPLFELNRIPTNTFFGGAMIHFLISSLIQSRGSIRQLAHGYGFHGLVTNCLVHSM